jgi:hypothetical protein
MDTCNEVSLCFFFRTRFRFFVLAAVASLFEDSEPELAVSSAGLPGDDIVMDTVGFVDPVSELH